MALQGVLYHGLEVMGGGAILSGLVLGAIGVFIVEREFAKASAFALAGALLTYFGFMHGEAVGIGIAFMFGLLMDVHEAGLLGEHALAYSLLSYGAIALHRRVPWFGVMILT